MNHVKGFVFQKASALQSGSVFFLPTDISVLDGKVRRFVYRVFTGIDDHIIVVYRFTMGSQLIGTLCLPGDSKVCIPEDISDVDFSLLMTLFV
jgi:hypothetical protein